MYIKGRELKRGKIDLKGEAPLHPTPQTTLNGDSLL